VPSAESFELMRQLEALAHEVAVVSRRDWAAWIYTRSGGAWSQQGNKLVSTAASGAAQQGRSVSLSSDGNMAIVGGPGDTGGQGAAWVYRRTPGLFWMEGPKLVGGGASGAAQQGNSIALSANVSTAIVGGPADNSGQGAAWFYLRSRRPPVRKQRQKVSA
jgi:hypothetical protein